MSSFTPGPWSVPHFARPDVGCECKYVLTDTCMGAVCAVYASGDDSIEGGDNPPFDEAVANAHLIASAPDLLEALKYVMSAQGEQLTDAFDQAHKAIAKAEGRDD